MIPRYEEKDISKLWSEEHKFELYLKVELALLETLEGTKVPKGTAKKIAEKAHINPTRIGEIEKIVQHDVIAFCTSITENLEPSLGKFFHFGVTSSDIIDTALTLQIKESLDFIVPALQELCTTLKNKALETKDIITLGRSHGMFAEPMSFGQKFLSSYAEFSRHLKDLQNFYEHDLTGQISGAVGNYTILNSRIEEETLKKLGLKAEPISTQVIPRDRIAKMVSIMALIASAIERISIEIRHLHRSDVAEVQEGFAKGQKGSSIMPHKKNPIAAENLCGMARTIRSHLTIAHENIALWHERDISHSSTERMYLPDHLGLTLYSLRRLNKTLNNLVILKENIEAKVQKHFDYLASLYLHHLIEQTDRPREELYEILQTASFTSKTREEFYENILKLCEDKKITVTNLPNPTDLRKIYLKEVDSIFNRVLN